MNSTRSSAASSRDDGVGSSSSPKTTKTCGVCTDVARCYHFGGLCCASCKAFFRRAVVNGQYKPYRCVYGGQCRIDIASRKHCSYCRLKRCLAIGMDKKWFMSEEMRAELKLKSLKKQLRNNNPSGQQQQQQLMLLSPNQLRFLGKMPSGILSSNQLREIQTLAHLCRLAYEANVVPAELQSDACHSSASAIAVIFATVIRRTFHFLESVPQLSELVSSTKMSLLKERGIEALIILSALTFNPISRTWKKDITTLAPEPVSVHVCSNDFELLHGPLVTRKHLDTISSLLALNADEQIIALLSLVAFFTLDGNQFVDSVSVDRIQFIQEHFIDLLKRYIQWKFGMELSEKVFARFILKLSDVREVNNLHKVARLRLSNDEIHQVEDQGGLDLLNKGTGSSWQH